MGNRLSKIYTRTGDAGTTGLGDGRRVSKDSLRIHALGEIDETNSVVGLLLCEELPEDVRALAADQVGSALMIAEGLGEPGRQLADAASPF